MIKVKIVKDHQMYYKGDIKLVTANVAFGLIEEGIAVEYTHKQMRPEYKKQYKTK